MARARNIKPGLFKNEILGVADPIYTLLFEGLWVLADRSGRLGDRPLRIKGEVFPYRDGLNVDAMLNWLESNGFIRRYTAQGKKCILVLEFVKHQNPHKNETESELPAPSDERTQPEEIGTVTEIIGSTRADSLSSDSLIPDSLTPSNEGVARTLQGEACMAMKAAGMAGVNPSHPKLTALLEAGITVPELVAAAADAVAKGKPFAYALASAEGRRRDAATAPLPNVVQRDAPVETYAQRAARQRMEEVAPMAARKQPGSAFDAAQRFMQGEVIDVAAVPKQLARVV